MMRHLLSYVPSIGNLSPSGLIAAVAILSAGWLIPTSHAAEPQTVGQIERLSPAIDRLVPPDAQLEILVDGHDWSEGPLWVPADGGFLIYSDVPQNEIHRWDSRNGHSLYLTPSGYTGHVERSGESGSNGLALDRAGRLLLCQHGDRRVARLDASLTDPHPKFVSLAERYQGKRFNSPNDLSVASNGAVYFTDPPYGLAKKMEDPTKEIPFQGVYRADPDETVTLLTDEFERPNGIALSPDEKTLYVANSYDSRKIWKAFSIQADGSLGPGRMLFDANELGRDRVGYPDGMKVDVDGNLWATGPGGVLVISPDGTHLGTLLTGQATSNCAFGEDGSTLFVTADRYLLRIRLSTKGLGF